MAGRLPNLKARTQYKQRLLLGLVFKPLRLFCEYCDKYIPSDMPWRCSHCDHANDRTKIYSFLNKCRECKRVPKSYACPHCSNVNFLDKDSNPSHPARSTMERPPVETSAEEVRLQKKNEHNDRKEEIEREIEITRLNASLVELKASTQFQKAKSTREKLEESFSEHDAHVMGAQMIADEQRVKNAEKYKDDSNGLGMANESIAMWLEKQL